MRTIVLVTFLLSVFTFLTLPLVAQEVEVVCSDNQTIQGSLEGFQDGQYRIRVKGELKVIPEDDVITLTILDRREQSTSGLEGVEAAFGEGRIMDAMRAIHHMLNQIPFKNHDLRRLALEQHRTGNRPPPETEKPERTTGHTPLLPGGLLHNRRRSPPPVLSERGEPKK